jgi:hypothetical protein
MKVKVTKEDILFIREASVKIAAGLAANPKYTSYRELWRETEDSKSSLKDRLVIDAVDIAISLVEHNLEHELGGCYDLVEKH